MSLEPAVGRARAALVSPVAAAKGAKRDGGKLDHPGIPEPDENQAAVELIASIAGARDREAFKQLFQMFAPRLKAYARRSGAPAQVAEDLLQDVMLSVWRRAGQYDRDKAAVSTWIFTIARNRRIDMLRRDSRPDFDPEDPTLQGGPEMPADAWVESRQRAQVLRRAVETLPEEQSELLRLAYFEDKTHGAIAEELNLPLGTVKSRIRLAMGKLRTTLKDET